MSTTSVVALTFRAFDLVGYYELGAIKAIVLLRHGIEIDIERGLMSPEELAKTLDLVKMAKPHG